MVARRSSFLRGLRRGGLAALRAPRGQRADAAAEAWQAHRYVYTTDCEERGGASHKEKGCTTVVPPGTFMAINTGGGVPGRPGSPGFGVYEERVGALEGREGAALQSMELDGGVYEDRGGALEGREGAVLKKEASVGLGGGVYEDRGCDLQGTLQEKKGGALQDEEGLLLSGVVLEDPGGTLGGSQEGALPSVEFVLSGFEFDALLEAEGVFSELPELQVGIYIYIYIHTYIYTCTRDSYHFLLLGLCARINHRLAEGVFSELPELQVSLHKRFVFFFPPSNLFKGFQIFGMLRYFCAGVRTDLG